MNYKTWSVGVIITNPQKTFFYLQQKDNTYFIKKYRLKYCFFGGNIEDNEKETETLKRELEEELNIYFSKKILENIKRLFDTYFINPINGICRHTLYEAIIDDKDLTALSKIIPNEGKGILVNKDELMSLPVFNDLEEAKKLYLDSITIN